MRHCLRDPPVPASFVATARRDKMRHNETLGAPRPVASSFYFLLSTFYFRLSAFRFLQPSDFKLPATRRRDTVRQNETLFELSHARDPPSCLRAFVPQCLPPKLERLTPRIARNS